MEEQVSVRPAFVKRVSGDLEDYPSKRLQIAPGTAVTTGREEVPSLPVLRIRQDLYDANFPFYQQPVEIGSFSLDADRRFFNDARQLRYYRPPSDEKNPGFDLRDGYLDRFIKRDESIKERLDHLLKWITLNLHHFRSGKDTKGVSLSCLNRDFVTWRGHLTKILTTPYENQEGWLLAITLFKGTFYISEVETEQARQQREERTADHEEMMYMGYKFEQYLCAAEPGGSPDPAGVVNTNEAFCSVVQTKLHGHSLLFSGEVDCKDPAYPNQKAPGCYVELKTSKEIRSPNQQRSFNRYKLIKWWAQSFLPGVPRIIAGFRDEEGKVVSMQTFETMKISHLIRGEWNSWKPAVCMNFCNAFLTFVKKVVTEDDPHQKEPWTTALFLSSITTHQTVEESGFKPVLLGMRALPNKQLGEWKQMLGFRVSTQCRTVHLFSWEPRRDVSYTVHKDSDFSFLPHWYLSAMTTPEK